MAYTKVEGHGFGVYVYQQPNGNPWACLQVERRLTDFMHIENNLLLQWNKTIINGIDLWTT